MDLHSPLKKFFGFNKFKGLQEQVIKSIVDKKNTFVIMPTGGGKSLCYQLPALISDGCAIVVSPLIALMKNQVDVLRGHYQNDSIAHVLNSSLTKTQTNQVKEDILELEEVSDVNLKIVWEPPWDKDKMSEAAKLELNL